MNWYKQAYFGKKAEKKRDRIARDLEQDSASFSVYLIVLPLSASNQLEILSARSYLRRSKQYGETLIIGAACGMDEAKELTAEIAGDVFSKTGTACLRNYFGQSVPSKNVRAHADSQADQ